MKKISVMVVVALMSASMFANGASLPTKTKTVKTTPAKTEVKHKQDKAKSKDKGTTKEKKSNKKESKHTKATPAKA